MKQSEQMAAKQTSPKVNVKPAQPAPSGYIQAWSETPLSRLPVASNNRQLRQAAALQMQREWGNRQALSALTRRPDAPNVQREGEGALEQAQEAILVAMPAPVELSERDRQILNAILLGASLLPGTLGNLASIVRLARSTAAMMGVTVGIGPAVTAGLGLGISRAHGIYFGPSGEIGAYGSVGGRNGALAGISATAQVIILRGGPSGLGGYTLALGVGGGELAVGGATALFTTDGDFLGVSVEVGVGAGIPIEVYAEVQAGVISGSIVVAPP
jgi:hypothetical protein